MFIVEITESVVKRTVIEAEDAADAMLIASDMEIDEFDFVDETPIKNTIVPLDDEDGDDEDLCDGFDDCEDCPDYCEVCGSCAREADFVSKRGECADCKHRCSACGTCTFDE
ncbi:hypothetical protein SDC9_180904 [bioreactor metagenome]|uniref:Uncharacterized protein n=1 Tax=bioreactor metagenome TaxID=1076179 RepID=A0A645H339_9ZZZZ